MAAAGMQSSEVSRVRFPRDAAYGSPECSTLIETQEPRAQRGSLVGRGIELALVDCACPSR